MNLKKLIPEAIEKKSLTIEGNFVYFEGYLSTFGNADSYNDIVQKGAFKKTLKNRKPALLYQHDTDIPLGVFEELKEDDHGLYFKAKLPLDDKFVKERLLPQLQIGSLNSMSIGYSTDNYTIDEKTDVRYLNEVTLYEGSIVTIPANDQALIKSEQMLDEIKALPKKDQQDLIKGIKTWLEKDSSEEKSESPAKVDTNNTTYFSIVAEVIKDNYL